jgi:chemotaxis signal transduction protein
MVAVIDLAVVDGAARTAPDGTETVGDARWEMRKAEEEARRTIVLVDRPEGAEQVGLLVDEVVGVEAIPLDLTRNAPADQPAERLIVTPGGTTVLLDVRSLLGSPMFRESLRGAPHSERGAALPLDRKEQP